MKNKVSEFSTVASAPLSHRKLLLYEVFHVVNVLIVVASTPLSHRKLLLCVVLHVVNVLFVVAEHG